MTDAMLLLDRKSLSSAADRAYYAMFHAAHAGLSAVGVRGIRSHRGLRSQFGERLVLPGLVERQNSRDLTFAHEIRQETTYEAFASIEPNEVSDLVGRARRFVDRITKLVGEKL